MTKKILLALLAIFIILQFFQIDKTSPEYDNSQDFLAITNPPAEVSFIIKTACYDCHSYETKYPWYTSTQPVGWWIKDHIDEGRSELNFSEWGTYTFRRADHKLDESIELVEELEMPLPSYLRAHKEARLTDAQRETLTNWFSELRAQMQADEQASEEPTDEG